MGQVGSVSGNSLRFHKYSWSSSKESNYAAKDVVEVAQQKLRGSKFFASSDIKHTLAILGQRFGLEICLGHPEVVERVESG